MLNLLYLIFISLIIIMLSHYGLNYIKNTEYTNIAMDKSIIERLRKI